MANIKQNTTSAIISDCDQLPLGCPSKKCDGFETAICGPGTHIALLDGLAMLALMCNSFHVIFLKQHPRLIRGNYGFTVMSLAVIDIITSLTVLGFSNCLAQKLLSDSQMICNLSLVFNGLPPIFSALTLMLSSIDRVHELSKAFNSQRVAPITILDRFQRRFRLCFFLLNISVFILMITVYIIDIRRAKRTKSSTYPCHTGFTMCMLQGQIEYGGNLASVLMVLLPLLVGTCCYGSIFLTLGRLTQRAPRRVLSRLNDSIRCIGLMLLTFIVSYLPIIISMMLRMTSKRTGPTVQLISVLTFYGSSLCNPLVYVANSVPHKKVIANKLSAFACFKPRRNSNAVRPQLSPHQK